MLSDTNSDGGSDKLSPALSRLAEALDIAPTAFFDATASDLGQTTELLRSWHAISDKHDREKVLAIMHTFASRA
ncbi:hypothetical protein [Methylobacterium sp. WL8]|uniref:hypothetical protein n=1 Tax=Methylobacterium sp. WL8 TaxID=2603899 RepID=UPI0011C8E8F6|nr:hypothetical protein [Methylobacterium sp. WL8]TXN80272.1 hypothetical protein FV234_17400 [Methylobacterium sp. WL8]